MSAFMILTCVRVECGTVEIVTVVDLSTAKEEGFMKALGYYPKAYHNEGMLHVHSAKFYVHMMNAYSTVHDVPQPKGWMVNRKYYRLVKGKL